MTQQYYYSSLTGQQLDAALEQIPQAAVSAAAAEASAQTAHAHAQAAETHAQAALDAVARADSYSKGESDSRFASAIVLRETGSVLTLPWAAPLPLDSLTLFGTTHQAVAPTPAAPVFFPEAPMPRVILAGQNLWNNENAVIEAGGSCWTATDTGFSFHRGDYTGTGCVYVPVAIPRGSTLRFRSEISGNTVTCCLYGNGISSDLLESGTDGGYAFSADRDYPNAVAAVILPDGAGDAEIANITLGFAENTAFTPGIPPQILETGLPLYGIPVQAVTTKNNYMDKSGQKWFTDEIDLDRGVYIQRCFTLTFDGTEPWFLASAGWPSLGSKEFEPLKNMDHGQSEPDNGYCVYLMCSHFPAYPRNGSHPEIYVTTVYGTHGNAIAIYWPQYNNDLDGWKAWLAAQAAAGTPMTMVLGMKKPVETPLPRQLVESLWVLRLRAGENLLYNDASAVMQAAYVADTGRYLEAKLAQLSAAILQ